MIISGKLIAKEILLQLQQKQKQFKIKKMRPTLAVVLIGNDLNSIIYTTQKKITGEKWGFKVIIYHYKKAVTEAALRNKIQQLNTDNKIHGIIIQRPIPIEVDHQWLNKLVIPTKDVDGFHPQSKFIPPIALAVMKILQYISDKLPKNKLKFNNWLRLKKVLVIGRGETGGKPIASYLAKLNTNLTVAHSKTINLKALCLNSDIIISCVGKSHIVRQDMLKNGCILIGVGLHKKGKKLYPDYNQKDIINRTLFYTPVPGGVGPVNVACLFANLKKASETQIV